MSYFSQDGADMIKNNICNINSELWKNHQGNTRELLRIPENSTMENFLLRISVAEMTRNSDFSSYPGMDRTLILLKGNGLTLYNSFDNRLQKIVRRFEPYCFSGNDKIRGELSSGPILDFNVMNRHPFNHAEVQVLYASGTNLIIKDRFIFIAKGHAQTSAINNPTILSEGDFFIATENYNLCLFPDSIAFSVNIRIPNTELLTTN